LGSKRGVARTDRQPVCTLPSPVQELAVGRSGKPWVQGHLGKEQAKVSETERWGLALDWLHDLDKATSTSVEGPVLEAD
jgi:hypothetical protein